MTRSITVAFALLALVSVNSVLVRPASAVQYPTLDPTYTQEIYTGPLVGGPGMAWTSSNELLTRNGSDILEYSPTQNTTHQGTSLHGVVATHTISGLSSTAMA